MWPTKIFDKKFCHEAGPYARRISRKSESDFNLISDSRDLTHDFLTFLISDAGRIGKSGEFPIRNASEIKSQKLN